MKHRLFEVSLLKGIALITLFTFLFIFLLVPAGIAGKSDNTHRIPAASLPCTPEDSHEWVKTLGVYVNDNTTYGLVKTPDSGYVVLYNITNEAETEFDFAVVKLDACGNIIWETEFIGFGDSMAYAIDTTTNGGLVITGLYGPSIIDYRLFILKLDADGEIQWSNYTDNYVSKPNDITWLSTNEIAITGYQYFQGPDQKLFVAKYDSDGNELWFNTYSKTDTSLSGIEIVEHHTSHKLTIAGVASNGQDDAYILHLTPGGGIINEKIIGNPSTSEIFHGVARISDGYVFAGTSEDNGNQDFWVYKTSVGLNYRWQNKFGGIGDDTLRKICETVEGGLIAVGTSNSPDTANSDICLVKMNHCGDTTWVKTYGSPSGYDDHGDYVQTTNDSGFIIGGSARFTPTSKRHSWIIKIPPQSTYPEYKCGDANGDCQINLNDISYLIDYLYRGGPPPIPLEAGDANGNGVINVLDTSYLVSYLYKGGPPPVCPPES